MTPHPPSSEEQEAEEVALRGCAAIFWTCVAGVLILAALAVLAAVLRLW